MSSARHLIVHMTEHALGVDFGRVINDGSSHPSGDGTSFLTGSEDAMLATPAMEGAFGSLERLTELFHGRVWIVSKAGPRIQANTECWLGHHGFFTTRLITDKAAVCTELGITHFVDDRAEVLKALIGIVPHLFLFGPQNGLGPDQAITVPTWSEAEGRIAQSLSA